MMRKLIIAVSTLCAVMTLGSQASAAEVPKIENPILKVKTEPVKPESPKPVEYIAVKNDNLTKIAQKNNTTWVRLWQKNTNLADPNKVKVGDKFVIPPADEVLAGRPLPVSPPSPPPAPVAVAAAPKQPASPTVKRRASVAGNTYARGYCTWHVKNMRPDLPNRMGNADRWITSARAHGLPTGSTPRVGAAGVTKAYMHVVYITAVNGNTVTVSEMNYRGSPGGGFGKVSTRTTSASEFLYIY